MKLNNIEMQGTVLAGLKCSVSIDSIGKEAMQNTHDILYKYKQCTSIPPISLIDDILAVTECSSISIQSSATIRAKLSTKQLILHEDKCFQLHFGKQKKSSNSQHPFLESSSNKNIWVTCFLPTIQTIKISMKGNKGIGYENQILMLL